MSSTPAKKQLFEQFAKVGKALGSAPRLEILELLAQRERTVEALAQLTALPVANVSQHLQALRRASLVAARKAGLYVHYRLASTDVAELLFVIQRVAEHEVEEVGALVRTYLAHKDALEPVSREWLLTEAKAGRVTVVDVRPAEEFAAGHIPHALNVPLDRLASRLAEFPPEREVVAYCRGPFCVLAYEAVARLRARGLRARRLEGGFPQWRAAALPVETG
jgi:rhodanese-related sulfurtransferase/DNA-binding transcriptional ArsR family regulator